MPFPMFSGGGGEPGAPYGVNASNGGNVSAVVFFTPPDYLGKATVTYSVTSTPATSTQIFSASGQTFTGLTNGTSYTFVVRTLTDYSVYSGPSDASSAITPVAPPPSFGPAFPPNFPPDFSSCAGVVCGGSCGSGGALLTGSGYSSQFVVGGPGELGVCGTCTGVPMYVYQKACCDTLYCWTQVCQGCPTTTVCDDWPTGWVISGDPNLLGGNDGGSTCGARSCEYSWWQNYTKAGCSNNFNYNYGCANCPGDPIWY